MDFNNKKLEKTSKLINYTISILLCGFLISLSGKVIDDIDDWKAQPVSEQFENKELLDSTNAQIEKINEELNQKFEQKSNIENTKRIAESNYDNAKNSFDNWLAARKTIGSPKEDKEVLSRAKELDEFYKIEQDWRNELSVIDAEISEINKNKKNYNEIILKEQNRAYEERIVALRKYDLKIFLIRLLFILPILLLGIYFVFKYRKHKYWPLFLGFVLFSFYSFFFGLVPYLPSYGGYVRYSVGIILSIVLGIYTINKIKAFIERKKEELKISTTERAKKVQTETAEKALNNHMCPSCGKDFIMKQWDKSANKKGELKALGYVTNFCRFCGLELFKKCDSCGTENFAHLPYCSNCGDTLNKK